MQKTLRKIAAEETLKIINKGLYFNQKKEKIYIQKIQKDAVDGTVYYSANDLDDFLYRLPLEPMYDTIFEVIEETTIESIIRNVSQGYENPMCLNFASAKNPGGGFLNGAQAQEESIARSSGLYICQLSAMEFYETHRNMKSCIYTDGMIYSPQVPIFRTDDGKLLEEPLLSSIITAAAVNTSVVKKFETHKIAKIENIMKVRIEKLLALSNVKNHKTLILGAWGCGVFQNDPKMIASLFSGLLKGKYRGVFEKVVFAIYANSNKYIDAFQKEFKK